MAQRSYKVSDLPESAIEASAIFQSEHLDAARALIGKSDGESLAIILPSAPYDHADWRRAMARDLARAYTPARVNVVAGSNEASLAPILDYLAGAKGVTGHYLEVDD